MFLLIYFFGSPTPSFNCQVACAHRWGAEVLGSTWDARPSVYSQRGKRQAPRPLLTCSRSIWAWQDGHRACLPSSSGIAAQKLQRTHSPKVQQNHRGLPSWFYFGTQIMGYSFGFSSGYKFIRISYFIRWVLIIFLENCSFCLRASLRGIHHNLIS